MAGEQQAVRLHHVDEVLQDLGLGRLVEIDHHVAAEDHVELLRERPIAVEQVDLAEVDHRLQLGPHAGIAFLLAGAAQEILLEPVGGQRRHALHRVDAGAGARQGIGIHIGGDHAHLPRRHRAEGLRQRDRNRIRLLPRRGGRAPYRERRALGLGVLGQDREMMLLAEERGQVGGERIGEGLPLVGQVTVLQRVQVIAERSDVDDAQPPRQAAVDHLALAVGQRNADAAIDQAADAGEIFRRERKLARRERRRNWRQCLCHGELPRNCASPGARRYPTGGPPCYRGRAVSGRAPQKVLQASSSAEGSASLRAGAAPIAETAADTPGGPQNVIPYPLSFPQPRSEQAPLHRTRHRPWPGDAAIARATARTGPTTFSGRTTPRTARATDATATASSLFFHAPVLAPTRTGSGPCMDRLSAAPPGRGIAPVPGGAAAQAKKNLPRRAGCTPQTHTRELSRAAEIPCIHG